jgi:hypothetical protein
MHFVTGRLGGCGAHLAVKCGAWRAYRLLVHNAVPIHQLGILGTDWRVCGNTFVPIEGGILGAAGLGR